MRNETKAETHEPAVLKNSRLSVAVIGNPNTGKSTLFNSLTGLRQHVGNYPGVTVERKTGTAVLDEQLTIELLDLPGTYSLAARSPDEMIAVDVLLGQQAGEAPVSAILAIADASNPERNFYLVSQLCELGLPVLIALNMCDVAEKKAIRIDIAKLSEKLGVPVVGICANKGRGIPELKKELARILRERVLPNGPKPEIPAGLTTEVEALHQELQKSSAKIGRSVNRLEAFRALVDKDGYAETRLCAKLGDAFKTSLDEHRKRASNNPLAAEEVRARYFWVRKVLSDSVARPAKPPPTKSDTIDKFVTHGVTGTLIFAGLMFLVFQSIFKWASPLMDGIDSLFGAAGDWVGANFADGPLRSLVQDGIIAGVGGVLIFLPQICLLFLFIAILEDCGYMARAAFLMDRLLSRVGLSGKSFIPMLSSFACAVPGVMATRTIENWRDRLTTILVAPLMSCSARLPVYTLMIATFIPDKRYLGGLIGLQAITMFAMYFVGIVVAIPVAFTLKKTLLRGETPPFLIELPSYKIPDWRGVLLRVFDRGKAFAIRAGTIILAVSIVVWALAYYPHPPGIAEKFEAERARSIRENTTALIEAAKPYTIEALTDSKESQLGILLAKADEIDQQKQTQLEDSGAEEDSPEAKTIGETHAAALAELEKAFPASWPQVAKIRALRTQLVDNLAELEKEESGEYLRQSYFGRMGHAVEPAFTPLGWDWRISMAALASFPAREVIVATLGTIFNLGKDETEESESLRQSMRDSTWDHSERKLFNIPVALSVMVFFALCSQCAATLATIKRETNSWKWPLFSFVYMTALAYLGALAVFQIATGLGWG